ncbi:hypothetical protein DERP_004689 [Dermatophagoides pteronyssinus]|uniref:Uncharacterized protein n=1 Tax=Dermatophagoides pteronyssinus TaxID=6956 RepID=A0ABQ8JPH1_DERPT|nr:hypothetical protein DERP_004689 [Dermatophagoides pteronyssinus]
MNELKIETWNMEFFLEQQNVSGSTERKNNNSNNRIQSIDSIPISEYPINLISGSAKLPEMCLNNGDYTFTFLLFEL